MTVSNLIIADVVIAVLGLCVLLPLYIATYVGTARDYSRTIYIAMLHSCALVLVTEAVQFILEGNSSGNDIIAVKAVLYIFYTLLSVLCFCWTVYSYFWFSGRRPAGRVLAGLAAGPVLELIMLIINIFSGKIYYVDSEGVYFRGAFFGFFVAFCYLYLIMAIIIMAVSSAATNDGVRKESFRKFLFFFLFPVVGPIAQYVFPNIPLMGITEAVALVAVYVSFQQRTTAQHAVEMAHLQDATDEYERSLENLLTASADALCVFRLNITQDTHSGERGIPEGIMEHCRGDSIDDLFEAFTTVIRDPDEAAEFRKLFCRETMINEYENSRMQFSLKYHRRIDSGETHLVKSYVGILKNPRSGDIEAIAYSADIDRADKEERVIFALTDREYDYIMLIDAETRKIHYRYSPSKDGVSAAFKTGDYDEVVKKSFVDMNVPDEYDSAKISFDAVKDALDQMDEYNFIFSYTLPSGKILYKRLTYLYLDEKHDEILFFRSDITEEIKQERKRADVLRKALVEARHADAMKTEFLSNVSHDIRTPLNSVLGYVDLAMRSDDPEEIRNYIGKIDRAGKILLSLINDTLDLSKIEQSSIRLKPEPMHYGEIIKKVFTTVAPAAEAKHIELIIDDSRAEKVPIMIDKLRMQEILINLLSNAIKFTPENGRVTFRLECIETDEKTVRDKITISDTGCGMKSEFVPKMFEPFAQERQIEDTAGSGLGLSIVKRLVDLMNGKIEVMSEPGRGTEFTLWFDFERADEPDDAAEEIGYGREDLYGRKILLADDNEMNIELAKVVLETQKMTVVCAENGREACEIFRCSETNEFDAILMDVRMPVMDGRTAAMTIRRMDRADAAGIPIIALSADAFDDDIQASLDAGMDAHISKPLVAEKLYAVISNLTAG